MEIQLTRTKTITIGGGPAKKRGRNDVVGVELFGGDSRGCPAVRIQKKKGVFHLTTGFIPAPANDLPGSWEDASKSCSWAVPSEFQAPNAALAVTSPDMFLVQTTPEAFKSDFAQGFHKDEAPRAKSTKLGIIKAADSKPASKPATASTTADPKPGEPISNGGMRFVMRPMNAEGFVMEAGLPEYQTLWLSRLLPEGRRPTTASIQLKPLSLTASITRHAAFTASGGTLLAVFIGSDSVSIAGYKDGDLALWRNCRNAPGSDEIRSRLCSGLGMEPDMIDSVLEEKLIDPKPALDTILAPLMEELAVSRDYFVGKLGIEPKTTLVQGLVSGMTTVAEIALERINLKLEAAEVFAGCEGTLPDRRDAAVFAPAFGAALALMEEEA